MRATTFEVSGRQWRRETGAALRGWASALKALRHTGAALVLGLMALGAGLAWSAHEARQSRLSRLYQAELHENRILRARQAALLDRAFELAKRVDAEAARWSGDVRPARSATERICREAEAASMALGRGAAPAKAAPPGSVAPCAAAARLQPAAQLRAAL
jgi:hypothetical protein